MKIFNSLDTLSPLELSENTVDNENVISDMEEVVNEISYKNYPTQTYLFY